MTVQIHKADDALLSVAGEPLRQFLEVMDMILCGVLRCQDISKFPYVLQELQEGPSSVSDLYKVMSDRVTGISEFMDVLDCLFALNRIDFDKEEEVLRCVERNSV